MYNVCKDDNNIVIYNIYNSVTIVTITKKCT